MPKMVRLKWNIITPPPFSNKKDRKDNSRVFNKKEGRLNNLQLEV